MKHSGAWEEKSDGGDEIRSLLDREKTLRYAKSDKSASC